MNIHTSRFIMLPIPNTVIHLLLILCCFQVIEAQNDYLIPIESYIPILEGTRLTMMWNASTPPLHLFNCEFMKASLNGNNIEKFIVYDNYMDRTDKMPYGDLWNVTNLIEPCRDGITTLATMNDTGLYWKAKGIIQGRHVSDPAVTVVVYAKDTPVVIEIQGTAHKLNIGESSVLPAIEVAPKTEILVTIRLPDEFPASNMTVRTNEILVLSCKSARNCSGDIPLVYADVMEIKIEIDLAIQGAEPLIFTQEVTECLLPPSLEVDGNPKKFSMEIVGVEGRTMEFRVKTGASLKANSIVFTRKGFDGIDEELVVQTCKNQTVCEYSMKLSHSGNFSIHINVTYPVCTPISRTIHMEVQSASKVRIGVLVTVCIILAVVSIIVIVVIWHRKKRRAQSKNNNTEQTHDSSTEHEPLNEEGDQHLSDNHDDTTKMEQNGEDKKLLVKDDHFEELSEKEVAAASINNDNNTHEQINNTNQPVNGAEQRKSLLEKVYYFKDKVVTAVSDIKDGFELRPFDVED